MMLHICNTADLFILGKEGEGLYKCLTNKLKSMCIQAPNSTLFFLLLSLSLLGNLCGER